MQERLLERSATSGEDNGYFGSESKMTRCCLFPCRLTQEKGAMKINTAAEKEKVYTAPGAVAARINPVLQLRRLVMACLLWEKNFHCEGVDVTKAIAETIPLVDPDVVAAIAIEARERQKLRHVPLFIVREMARLKTHRHLVAETLARVIQRPDELAEYLAIYWKDGRAPLSAQSKKGLACAFGKFSEYQLAKWNQDGVIKLRDVLFLCHAKPAGGEQDALWKRLIGGELQPPDTWEVGLSASKDKKAEWERLLLENKLGALALLRNLRNMTEVGVEIGLVKSALEQMKTGRVLPFRFVAAARYAPKLEPELESAMYRALADVAKLPGKTVFIVDVSGSMNTLLSGKSEMTRMDVACALSILARELCEDVAIYATAGDDYERKHATEIVPGRRGFALRDAVTEKNLRLGSGGIFLVQCMNYVYEQEKSADRIIVLTDEQDCDQKLPPQAANAFGRYNYLVNVASEKNGIGYGKWCHIDGWSEAVLDFIQAKEAVDLHGLQ